MMLLHIPSVYDSPCAALQASFELAALFRDVLGVWGFSFQVETSSSALKKIPASYISLIGRASRQCIKLLQGFDDRRSHGLIAGNPIVYGTRIKRR